MSRPRFRLLFRTVGWVAAALLLGVAQPCPAQAPSGDVTVSFHVPLAGGGYALAGGLARAFAQSKVKPGPQDLLLVVDVQNCFTPRGSMAKAWQEMLGAGVRRIQSADVAV